MKIYKHHFFIFCFIFYCGLHTQAQNYIIQHGTIHVGNGQIIEDGQIIIEKNKIKEVGKYAPLNSKEYTVIDATNKQIYPGLILANSTVGLVEIEAIRATHDDVEVNAINSNVRALVAFNTDSKLLPTFVYNGITYAQVCPIGGLVAGSSSVMKLNGWNWEDAVQRTDDGIHLYFPSLLKWNAAPNENYATTYSTLEAFLADAKAYADTLHKEKNLVLEPMKDIFNGNKNLYIHVDGQKEIISAVLLAQKYGITPVLVGAQACEKVTDFLKEKKVSVILHKLHTLPSLTDADVNEVYKTPKLLKDAGILFCIGSNDGESWNGRNMMFNAGNAVAYGLSKEDALKAITHDAAVILKCDQDMGTLESGKNATLLISKGDLLDMCSNQLDAVMINGTIVDLNANWQKMLYEKYLEKYKVQGQISK